MSEAATSQQGVLLIGVFCMMLFGPLNVLVKESLVVGGFFFPLLWNMVTMLGQSFLLPIHYCLEAPAAESETSKPAPAHILITVTCIDLLALSLINSTYNALPGSIIQTLRGFKIIFTAILSKLILGKTLVLYQYAGVALSCIGVVFAGASSMTSTWDGGAINHSQLTLMAFLLGTASQFVGSCQIVFEAKAMKSYHLPPLQLAGFEGVIGAPLGVAVIVISYMLGGNNPLDAFVALRGSTTGLGLLMCFMVTVSCFNLSGLIVTKHGSPVLRAMLEIMRTAVIWVVEVICQWNQFSIQQCIALIAITLGTLIYGNYIKIPFLQPAPVPKQGALSEPFVCETSAAIVAADKGEGA